MLFTDRTAAGKMLAEELVRSLSTLNEGVKSLPVVVVALPRGGAPVALQVARRFHAPLEIISAKKLPFPNEPEYAMGAVSSDGVVVLSGGIPHGAPWKQYVQKQSEILLSSTSERENKFYELTGRAKASFKDKLVIVVDDGVATGMTAACALQTARNRGAKYLIMASPVMSIESVDLLKKYADRVIALRIPSVFHSVGQHYLNFVQTSDQEVIEAMRQGGKFESPASGLAN